MAPGSDEAATGEAGTPPRGKEPTILESLFPIGMLIGLLSLSYYLFRDEASYGPNQVALIFCALVAAGLAYKNGFAWEGIRRAMIDGVATGIGAIGILLAVGALIGTWALSGTIVAMVYYGLEILNPNYFYATAALICAAVAFSIGSSWPLTPSGSACCARSWPCSPTCRSCSRRRRFPCPPRRLDCCS